MLYLLLSGNESDFGRTAPAPAPGTDTTEHPTERDDA